MKVEAVIISKDYGDFLEFSLPENLSKLDNIVVVTHPNDQKTKDICNRYGVTCIETEVFHENGEPFNKAKAINVGLSHLEKDGWILHMDADVVLPPTFRSMLNKAKLNKEYIYGADRLNTISYANWHNHRHLSENQYLWGYLVTAIEKFPLGARLVHKVYGYCPIGYFQLWHSSAGVDYPTDSGGADHTDVLFAIQWPRERRMLLPELFVFHLESDGKAPQGINWKGRRTKPFGPDITIKKPSGGYV